MKYMRLFESYQEFNDFLYHGTLIDNEHKIDTEGLVPQIGAFVRNAYEGEYEAAGISIDDEEDLHLVFLGNYEGIHRCYTAITYMISKKLGINFQSVTEDMVAQHGLLLCVDPDQYGIENRPEDDENDMYPMTVEPGDYYSNETLDVSKKIKGQELVDFFKKHGSAIR